jgi:hypothetical protein
MKKTETTTPARAAAARANGAKSRGPVTAAGKLNSRRNALKHGLKAQTLTLDRESDDRFALTLSTLQEEHQPRTPTEHSLVFRIAHADWRTHRLWSEEKALFDRAMEEIRRTAAEPSLRTADCASRAFEKLAAQGQLLALLNRGEGHFDRLYHRSLRQLERLREAPVRTERVRALTELTKLKIENARTNPSTATKQTLTAQTNPSLMEGWRDSAELEARIAEFKEKN